MAEDERSVRYGVYNRLSLSIGTLCATALIEDAISTEITGLTEAICAGAVGEQRVS